MKHFPSVFLIGLGLALSCHHPEVEYVDFDTFQPISVQSAPFFMEDGNLNPDVAMMGDTDLEQDTKVARTEGVPFRGHLALLPIGRVKFLLRQCANPAVLG